MGGVVVTLALPQNTKAESSNADACPDRRSFFYAYNHPFKDDHKPDPCFVPDAYVNPINGTPDGNWGQYGDDPVVYVKENGELVFPGGSEASSMRFKVGYSVADSIAKKTTDDRIVLTWVNVNVTDAALRNVTGDDAYTVAGNANSTDFDWPNDFGSGYHQQNGNTGQAYNQNNTKGIVIGDTGGLPHDQVEVAKPCDFKVNATDDSTGLTCTGGSSGQVVRFWRFPDSNREVSGSSPGDWTFRVFLNPDTPTAKLCIRTHVSVLKYQPGNSHGKHSWNFAPPSDSQNPDAIPYDAFTKDMRASSGLPLSGNNNGINGAPQCWKIKRYPTPVQIGVGGNVYDIQQSEPIDSRGQTVVTGEQALGNAGRATNSAGQFDFGNLQPGRHYKLQPTAEFEDPAGIYYRYDHTADGGDQEQVAGMDCKDYGPAKDHNDWTDKASDCINGGSDHAYVEQFTEGAYAAGGDGLPAGYAKGSCPGDSNAGRNEMNRYIACDNQYRLKNSDGSWTGLDIRFGTCNDYQGSKQCENIKHSYWWVFPNYPGDHAHDDNFKIYYKVYMKVQGQVMNLTTGKGFPGVYIGFNMPYGTGSEPVFLQAGNNHSPASFGDGTYYFYARRNAQVSWWASGADQASQSFQRFLYDPNSGVAVDFAGLSGAYQTSGYVYNNQRANTPVNGYDFYYTNPILTTQKQVDTGSGWTTAIDNANVKPGQTVKYRITASNTGNGGATSNFVLQDLVPHNIDPNTITITRAKGSVGFGNVDLACTTADFGPYQCGVWRNGNTGWGAFDRPAPFANPTMPPAIHARINDFPAGGTVEIEWEGKVRNADQIGVYPKDYRFCNNQGNYSQRGTLASRSASDCQDYNSATGLQAVTNFARAGYHWGGPGGFSGYGRYQDGTLDTRGGSTSNLIRNPIPGDITCIVKTTSAQYDPNSSEIQSGCNGQSYRNNYIYANTPPYNAASFTTHIEPNYTMGPLEASVVDQANHTATGPGAYNGNFGTGALDKLIKSISSITGSAANVPVTGYTREGGNTTGINGVNWHNYFTASGAPRDYSFLADFKDLRQGNKGANVSKVCWPRYWETGFGISCKDSNAVNMLQVGVARPFVASDGDVHAGGGIDNLNCGGVASSQNTLDGNPGSSGLFVTATGSIASFNTTTKIPNYGVICRPDLVKSVKDYFDKKTPKTILAANQQPAADQGSYNGKVVKANTNGAGYYELTGSEMKVNARWTLYVDGDLYINENIVNDDENWNQFANYLDPANAASYRTPSLGVVVTGNIYIAPGVTKLDGFFFAGDNNASHGKINTCSGPGGVPTLRDNYTSTPSGPFYKPSDCKNQLTVNGMLMGRTFRFNRTFNQNAGQGGRENSAEFVNVNNRIRTATPPGFSDLGTSYIPPVYLGEKRPRY